MIKKLILILFLTSILVACQPGADGPRQIASYPHTIPDTAEVYAPPLDVPPTAILVYDANLDLTVWNVEDTANAALQKVADYDGYLSASYLWEADGKEHATLTFALPAGNYDRALTALKRLGDVTREQVSGKLYPTYSAQPGWGYTSHITLTLHQRFETATWPSLNVSDARPMRTLSSAVGVLVTLLSFLLDIAIWLTVVIGPFVIVGWGAKKIWNGMRQNKNSQNPVKEAE